MRLGSTKPSKKAAIEGKGSGRYTVLRWQLTLGVRTEGNRMWRGSNGAWKAEMAGVSVDFLPHAKPRLI